MLPQLLNLPTTTSVVRGASQDHEVHVPIACVCLPRAVNVDRCAVNVVTSQNYYLLSNYYISFKRVPHQ